LRLAVIDSDGSFIGEVSSGAHTNNRNVIPKLSKYFELVYVPTTRSIAALGDRGDAERLAGTLEGIPGSFGMEVPHEVIRFVREELPGMGKCRRIGRYLEVVLAAARGADMLLDPDYWPHYPSRVDLEILGCAPPSSLARGDVYYLARASGRGAVAVIQSLTDVRNRFPGEILLTYLRSVRDSANPAEAASLLAAGPALSLYWRSLSSGAFAAAFLISRGQLENLPPGCAGCRLLYPAQAWDPGLRRYRGLPKGDYVAAASRLVALKGVLELPRIHRRIMDETGLRLVVAGRFFDEPTKRAFVRAVEREGLRLGEDVALAGFLSKDNYYEVLAGARVLVYPSHSDSFSIVMLESLAAGTPVVAYDIPGPRGVYGGLPAVRFVREFDWKAMAAEAVRLAEMPEGERRGLVDDGGVASFLEDHSSWDRVAERVAEGIAGAATARGGRRGTRAAP